MNISLGSGNLHETNQITSQEVINYCISKNYPIHISLDYNVSPNFFESDNFKDFQPKFILKITVTKNLFKLKKHIRDQVQYFLKFYNLKKVGYIQLCNNPSSNFIYQYFLKRIILKYIKNNIISKVYLDVFPDYEKNLEAFINDDFYEGFVFMFNNRCRSITKNFLYKILKSKKKAIIYSPFKQGELLKNDKKNLIDKDQITNYLRFFKTISSTIEYIVFGTKNLDRLKFIENDINTKNDFLIKDKFDKIIDTQKTFNNY